MLTLTTGNKCTHFMDEEYHHSLVRDLAVTVLNSGNVSQGLFCRSLVLLPLEGSHVLIPTKLHHGNIPKYQKTFLSPTCVFKSRHPESSSHHLNKTFKPVSADLLFR